MERSVNEQLPSCFFCTFLWLPDKQANDKRTGPPQSRPHAEASGSADVPSGVANSSLQNSRGGCGMEFTRTTV